MVGSNGAISNPPLFRSYTKCVSPVHVLEEQPRKERREASALVAFWHMLTIVGTNKLLANKRRTL